MKCLRLIVPLLVTLLVLAPSRAQSQTELVFVGSGRRNIEAFRLDLATGALTRLGLAAELGNPSFFAIAPNHKFLYAISEGGSAESSGINAFSINAATGKLTFLNRQPAGGSGPCHVGLDAAGKNVMIANYGSGSFAAFPLAENGEVRPMSAFIQDQGSSVNPARQEGPHAHCIVAGPGDKFVYGCDLGLDKVLIFKFDDEKGTLVANDPPFVRTRPGAGPRHIAFHPNGHWAYLVNEMASTMTVFGYDGADGALREIQTLSTRLKDATGENTGAEVAVHPTGKFVYSSNRGDDNIAVFTCDPQNGRLTLIQGMATGGKIPRQFEIDPTGRYLLAANQASDNVVVFRIDESSGRLQATGSQARSDNPMCVRFILDAP